MPITRIFGLLAILSVLFFALGSLTGCSCGGDDPSASSGQADDDDVSDDDDDDDTLDDDDTTDDDDTLDDDDDNDSSDFNCYNPPPEPPPGAYLPLGVYYTWIEPSDNEPSEDEQSVREHFRTDFADLAAHGIDLLVATFIPADYRVWLLEEAEGQGLQVMMGLPEMQYQIMLPSPFSPELADQLAEELVELLRDEPALLGYYIADEPAVHDVIPENLAVGKRAMEKADPEHPAFACLALFGQMRKYYQAMQSEVLMTDVYPIWSIFSWPANFDWGFHIWWFQFHLEYARRITGGEPVWLVAQAFGCEYPWRKPIFEELSAMVLLSLNRGIGGVVYFIYQSLVDGYGYTLNALIDFDGQPTELYERMTAFHQNLNPIKNALLWSNPIDAIAEAQHPFDLGSFKHELGFHHLMVVNKDVLSPQTATVEIPATALADIEAIFDESTGEEIAFEQVGEAIRFSVPIGTGDGRMFRICTVSDR